MATSWTPRCLFLKSGTITLPGAVPDVLRTAPPTPDVITTGDTSLSPSTSVPSSSDEKSSCKFDEDLLGEEVVHSRSRQGILFEFKIPEA